jgi:hypothetical protein
LTTISTTFRSLDNNHDGRLQFGEGNEDIRVIVAGNDTLPWSFGSLLRVSDATNLNANDFIL